MNLHRLQVFASIAKNLSVTRASWELHSSQPALSQHLKILQAQYGTLFKKNGRRLELTDRGRSLLNDIQLLLAQLGAIDKKYVGNLVDLTNQTLVVGGSYGPSAAILPSVMARFRSTNPQVDLSITTRSGREIADLILQSRVDIAVISSRLSLPQLESETFRPEVHSVFVVAGNPLAKKRKIGLAEFATLPLIIRAWSDGRGWTEQLVRGLFAKGLKPNIVMRCESSESVKRAVRERVGVGILNRDLIEGAVQRGAFKIIEVSGLDLIRQSYIFYSKEKPLSVAAQRFLLILRAASKQHLAFMAKRAIRVVLLYELVNIF